MCVCVCYPDLETAEGGRYELVFELRGVHQQQAKVSLLLNGQGLFMLSVVLLQVFAKEGHTCRRKQSTRVSL